MKIKMLDFRSGKLFPFHFQLLGLVFGISGLLSLFYSPFLAPLLLILGLFIITGYQGIEFNAETRNYRTYNSFFMLKFGKWQKYNWPEKIYINSGRSRQKVYTMVTDGITVNYEEYNAYLKWDDGSKIWLTSRKDKNRLIKKLESLSGFFNLEVHDNTAGEHRANSTEYK